MELRGIEKSKTDCAAKLFAQLSDGNMHYGVVDSYERLRDLVMAQPLHTRKNHDVRDSTSP